MNDSAKENKVQPVKSIKKWILSIFLCIMVAYGCARFLTDNLIQPICVYGVSMEDTLYDHEVILVDKLTYRFSKPKRFDIVIFPYSIRENYIKRVIGLPGETVQIKEGKIYINGTRLLENYGDEEILDPGILEEERTLKENEYILLGDNRNHSTDSRNILIGPIEDKYIIGKACLRIYPFSAFGKIEK